MFKNHSIITYLLIFLVLSILLKIVGILNVSYSELAGYGLMFYGLGTVYVSMGRNKKKLLLVGTTSFFVGVILFINSNYDIIKLSNIVLPSIFFMLGSAFLILFFDDLKNNLLLTISVIFFISGIFFFTKLGTLNFSDFAKSALNIVIRYWPVVVILTAIILLLKKNQRSQK